MVASSRQTDFEPGDRVGRYELLCVLRQDHATTTWLARQRGSRRFEKLVALKTLLPQLAKDPGFVAVLAGGARSIQSIEDAHIVRSLDMGDHGGVPFVVFELVDGELIETLLAASSAAPTPADVAVTIAVDVCAALERAHEAGVVHGCVSPGNVVVTASGLAKVSGFGAAQVRAQDPTGRLARALGEDVRFSAPELALGAQLEPRTDVWGTGALLHCLLSGAPPARGTASLPPAVPAILQDLVVRAVATRPEDRFASARDLKAALVSAAKDAQLELSHPRVAGIVGERLGKNTVARRAAIDRAVVEAARREEARTMLATPPAPEARGPSSIPPKWIPPHIETLKPPGESSGIPPATLGDVLPLTPVRPPPDTVRMESMRPEEMDGPPPTTRRFGLLSQPPPKAPTPVRPTPVPPTPVAASVTGPPAPVALSPFPLASQPPPAATPASAAPTPTPLPARPSQKPVTGARVPARSSPLPPPLTPRKSSPLPPPAAPPLGRTAPLPPATPKIELPASTEVEPAPVTPAPASPERTVYGPLPPPVMPPFPAPTPAPSDPAAPFASWPQSAVPTQVIDLRASRARSAGLSIGWFAFALVAAIILVVVIRWSRTGSHAHPSSAASQVRRDPVAALRDEPSSAATATVSPTVDPTVTATPPATGDMATPVATADPVATSGPVAASSDDVAPPRRPRKKHPKGHASASASALTTSAPIASPTAPPTSTQRQDDTPGF